MMSTASFYSSFIEHLVDPAIRSAAFALAAGLSLLVFRVKDASMRLLAWTSVLYAALSMPFLGWLVPPVPVAVSGIFASHLAANPSASQPKVDGKLTLIQLAPADKAQAQVRSAAQPISQLPESQRVSWPQFAVGIYLLAAATFLARLGFGLALTRRLRRASRPIADSETLTILQVQARAVGVARLPALASSDAVTVPVTLGFPRPVILLPSTWREWEDPKLRAVVAHELAHVARKDSVTLMLATLYRCLFWFSPLSWWLERRLAELAEQVSDDWALRAIADRAYYAGILLGFMSTLKNSSGRVRWQGASMAKGARTYRRLERILVAQDRLSAGLRKPALAASLLCATPLLYLAAALRPSTTSQTLTPPEPPTAPEAARTLPQHAKSPKGGGVTKPPPTPDTPATPQPLFESPWYPTAPASPAPPRSSSPSVYTLVTNGVHGEHRLAILSGQESTVTFAGDFEEEDNNQQGFVILSGDSTTISGSSDDLDHAKKLRSKIKGDFIWFRREGKSYVIRDEATVKKAKALFAPQEALGKKQAEVGKQQEALGAQQEKLGTKQEEVGVLLPDLMGDVKKLEAAVSDSSRPRTQDDLARLQSQLAELQGKIGELQSRAGKEQAKLGERQASLGQQQAELGRKQAELGREQARLAREATEKMEHLLDEALAKGFAEPEAR